MRYPKRVITSCLAKNAGFRVEGLGFRVGSLL